MEFRMLGPIELWSAGQQCDLGSIRARGVLGILMLTPRTIVPTDVLIDRVWDTEPPAKARESLSVYITRLRAALRQALGENVRLVGRDRGYELDLDPDVIDLHQFRRLRRQADALAANGDTDHAALLLREADLLWRGQPFAGIRGDWVARMRGSLEEERRATLLKRVECELELGRHADLVGELHHLLAQYPLDEAFIAHQMTALYGSGRAGEALSLYRGTRSQLIDEQGTEPGPALADLHQRILSQDPDLATGLAGPGPSRPLSRIARPDNLPPEAAEFVGRWEELRRLTSEPGSGPQIQVIEGMGGVGKTALAVHAARAAAAQYPDGAFYLNFHTHDPGPPSLDAAEALPRLLGMLTAPATRIPATAGERAALLRAQLSRRRAILILDDAPGPDQVQPLLPTSGQSLILITTRRKLAGLAGAHALTLDALPMADAITLFRRVAGPDLAYDEAEAELAVQLCGRLPLAIQLAAGPVAHDHLPRLADLVEELAQSPALAAGPEAASPQVLSASDVSYRSLEPGHQRFFRRLGMNPCASISPGAAAALGGGTLAEARQALGALLDHHLLAQAPGGQFRLHDLIHEYAALRAEQEDSGAERRRAVSRLLDYYLHTADQADRMLHPFRRRMPVPVTRRPEADGSLVTPDVAATWLDAEWRNILLAAHYAGQHEWKQKCADLIHVLGGFLEVRAYWDEARAAHTMAMQAGRDLVDPARFARAALEFSEVSLQTGGHEAALPLAEEALEIYRSLGDRDGEADALDQVGMAHQRAGRSRESLAYFREAQALYGSTADSRGVASALSHAGIACWQLGQYEEAMDDVGDALLLYQEAGDRRGEAKTLNNLGQMKLHFGYHRDAHDYFEQSLEIFQEIGGPQNEAILHHNLGAVFYYKGSYSEGLAAYQRALALYREHGDLPNEAAVLNDIGFLYQSAESYDEALVYHQQARPIAEDIRHLPQQVTSQRGIAGVRRGSGRYGEAFDQYQAALKLAQEIGDPYQEAKILEGIAETRLSTLRPDAARDAFRRALEIFERLGVPDAESVRVRIDVLDLAFGWPTSESA